MRRWLITGAGGQLGRDLVRVVREAGDDIPHPLAHEKLDVTDEIAVRTAIDFIKPDVVVNCAAYHNLTECEENERLAERVNALGPLNLALEGVPLVHFSTNYVFAGDGPEPYAEDDPTDPQSAYARSKLLGEHVALRYGGGNVLVVRTCGLYGAGGNASKGGNFVQRVLVRLRAGETVKMVDDQHVQPTYTLELAEAVRGAVEQDLRGVLHLVQSGGCSWYDFAMEISQLAGVEGNIVATATDFNDPISRPANGLLATPRAIEHGLTMTHWAEALERYVREARP